MFAYLRTVPPNQEPRARIQRLPHTDRGYAMNRGRVPAILLSQGLTPEAWSLDRRLTPQPAFSRHLERGSVETTAASKRFPSSANVGRRPSPFQRVQRIERKADRRAASRDPGTASRADGSPPGFVPACRVAALTCHSDGSSDRPRGGRDRASAAADDFAPTGESRVAVGRVSARAPR